MGDESKTKKQLIQELSGLRNKLNLLAVPGPIPDNKRAIDELTLWPKLLDATSDSIFLSDLDGNFLYANQAAFQARGYSREEILKANTHQIVVPEYYHIVEEKIKELSRKGSITFEAAHLRKDGSIFPVEVHMSIVDLAGKKLILSVVHDLSQRKAIEKELLRALKMESVALLASGIASQFNTLLTHTIGNLDVIMAESKPDTQYYRLLEETEKTATRALDLARQMMTFARSGTPVKRTASIAGLLKDTVNFMLSGSNSWCNFYIAEDLHRAELDEGQFSQVIHNVILNASEAMPKGGIINITARNVYLHEDEVANLPEGYYIVISIQDHGHGIPSEDLSRIFDPYFTTRKSKLGLGLSIAYSIVKNHGGAITAESEHGRGSTFHIYLPASTEKDIKKGATQKPAVSGAKILIVDDESVVQNAGSRLLKRLGYERVEFATDGAEALNKYKEAFQSNSPFELVILDLTIPGSMGGKEVIKALLQVDPKANIIVSSGYFDDPLLSNFRHYGVKGILAKPYQLEELKRIL